MNAARNDAFPYVLRQALVVTANKGHARMDRQCLKVAEVMVIRHMTSGDEALQHLVVHGADVVLVDDELQDMSGWDFLRKIKANPRLARLPIIMVSAKTHTQGVMEAISLGCAGFMLRPYSLNTFFKHLSLARHAESFLADQTQFLTNGLELVREGRLDEATERFAKASQTPDEAQMHFEKGMRFLALQAHDQAIASFTAASRICAVMTEAFLGLARCWQAKNDEVRYRKALGKAAEICAKAKRIEHYKKEFLDIVKADPRHFNPFLSLGRRLMSSRDFEGAAMALNNAAWLTPDNVQVHVELAKAYHFRRMPEMAKRAASRALMLNDEDTEAKALFERFNGQVQQEPEPEEPEPKTRENMFPEVIPSMLYGVLYLAGMVTEGLHRFKRRCA